MSKPTELILPEDQWTEYNGQKIHWFIGDEIGQHNGWPTSWHAWGAYYDANGKCYPYRMHGNFNSKTRLLSNITVNKKPTNPGSMIYWDENTYNLLTK